MDRYRLCLYINFILNYSYFKKIVSQTKKKKTILYKLHVAKIILIKEFYSEAD